MYMLLNIGMFYKFKKFLFILLVGFKDEFWGYYICLYIVFFLRFIEIFKFLF